MEVLEKTNKKKSMTKNYIFNLIYQIFLMITPLITTPYISRVLGNDGTGKYTFCSSVLMYFTLFATLGFNIYGQRELSKHQGNKEKQSILFWEIIIARIIPTTISLLIFYGLIYMNIYDESYKNIFIVLGLSILSCGLDIVFLYQANEEFGKIISINFIVKLTAIISIFIFVKDRNDVVIYALIQALTILISAVSMIIYLPKFLIKVPLKDIKPLKHLIPTLILFLPTIATSIYTQLDKTLIGVLVSGSIEVDGIIKNISDIENGNYEYAERIVKMFLTIVTSLGVVMIPRNTKMYKEGNIEYVKDNIYKSIKYVFFIGFPLMFGIAAISTNLLPWFLGEGYEKAEYLMMLLSPLILLIGASNVFGLQYMIPTGKDKKFTIAITSGAVINLLINIILIPIFKSFGAAIGTLVGELMVTMVMMIMLKKELSIKKIFKITIKYFIFGIIMFIPCFILSYYLEPSIFNTICIAGCGVIVYGLLLLISKDEYLFFGINFIKSKIKK